MRIRVDRTNTDPGPRRRAPVAEPPAWLSRFAGNQAVARYALLQRHPPEEDEVDLAGVTMFDEADSDDETDTGNLFDEVESTGAPTTVTVPVATSEPIPDKLVKADGTLAQRLHDAADREVDSDKMLVAIRAAGPEERRAAGADQALVAKLSDLYKEDFFEGMVLLGARQTGTVAHGTPETADQEIRARLADYVHAAAEGGAQITGRVAVLTGAAWNAAIEKHFKGKMPSSLIEDYKGSINAFNHGAYVFIAADRGNPGTMIHEAVHVYSQEALQVAYGRAVNEGITEYFARKVTGPLNIERTQYATQILAAQRLVALAGEATVAAAYFSGALDGLASAVIGARSREKWDAFVRDCAMDEPGGTWAAGLAQLD